MKTLLFILTILSITNISYARLNRTYTSSQSTRVYSYANNVSNNSDQDRCQAEANYMAANRITGHVWGTIGSFEGVGYGSSPNCNTCSPGGNMTLTGDASAMDSSGRWYRVRSWR